jgi:hypothetical protein
VLTKPAIIITTPAVPDQPYRPASTVCTPPPPTDNSGSPPPSSGTTGSAIFLHVPNDPNNANAGETLVQSEAPAPPGYTCSLQTVMVPQGAVGGVPLLIPIAGMHCYWDYPE